MDKLDKIKLFNVIKDALVEMDNFPGDSVQDIWNQCLASWETGLTMNSRYEIEEE